MRLKMEYDKEYFRHLLLLCYFDLKEQLPKFIDSFQKLLF